MFSKEEIKKIIINTEPEFIEILAREAKKITEQFFGRTISLYAPLYLSNYCSSVCTYCGFSAENKIKRTKLSPEEIHREMKKVSDTGIENILLLTGESYQKTPLNYLKAAAKISKNYFTSVSMEVHPMEEAEYKDLYINGIDGITIYQETYDKTRYKEVHLKGKKSDYDFRLNAPQRAAKSGMRQITLGILLGLGNLSDDIYDLFSHLKYMENNFPGVEYSLSFPRLRKIKGKDFIKADIDDTALLKVICLSRIKFPRVGINLSTRETPKLRDSLLGIGVTRISAGSNTSVGGYEIFKDTEQEPQFDILDNRNVSEIVKTLKKNNFDPVFTDWRPIENF